MAYIDYSQVGDKITLTIQAAPGRKLDSDVTNVLMNDLHRVARMCEGEQKKPDSPTWQLVLHNGPGIAFSIEGWF